jgi:pimeloyl-ACP methyl ester carboxylesterase
VRSFSRWLGWLPMGLVRALMRRTFRSMMPAWSEETACALAIFDELIQDTLTKADILGILGRTVDYALRTFTPQDLAGWPGKVLLLFGEQDPATPPEVRQRLEALYPGCQVHLFEGAGHSTAATHQAEYLGVIEQFVAQA